MKHLRMFYNLFRSTLKQTFDRSKLLAITGQVQAAVGLIYV